MNAAELRALASEVREADLYNDRFAQAAEIMELLAWAQENKVEAVRRRHGYSVHVGLVAHNGDTILDTLRRAREASNG